MSSALHGSAVAVHDHDAGDISPSRRLDTIVSMAEQLGRWRVEQWADDLIVALEEDIAIACRDLLDACRS